MTSGEEDVYQMDDALDRLFNKILEVLAEIDPFSGSASPTIFVVYAHDNHEKGTANAELARSIMKWLRDIRSRTLSDQFPFPQWSIGGRNGTVQNILDDQFHLLTYRGCLENSAIDGGVDKVIVCGSQNEPADFDLLQSRIRGVVGGSSCHASFHHVLTELAFLKIRKANIPNAEHGIVPVALDGVHMDYLPFVDYCDLTLKLKSPGKDHLHVLFFQLLGRIYSEQGVHGYIEQFKNCYEEASKKIRTGLPKLRSGFEIFLNSEIINAQNLLLRTGNAAIGDRGLESRVRNLLYRLVEINRVLDRKRKLLRRLSPVPYRELKDVNPERLEGTCKWFVNHQLFQNWETSKTQCLLWVSADPGCGKSVLAKHLVDNVLLNTNARTTCYFFFKEDFENQRNPEGALRCILHQLFTKRPALFSKEILEALESDDQILASFVGLWDILTSVARNKAAGEIICVLDALDECEENGRSKLAKALCESYLREESESALKFLLTSRPYDHIQREYQILENCRPTIHLRGDDPAETDKISKEIDIVIKDRVHKLSLCLRLTEKEKRALQAELTRVENRTYLWVSLVLDVIRRSGGITENRLLEIVREVDTTSKAYEKILARSTDYAKAKKLLHVIVAAYRPLSLQEMAIVLAIREDHQTYRQLDLEPEDRFPSFIRDLCGLFVTIQDDKLYLIHQTAREFLVHNHPPNSLPCAGPDTNRISTRWQGSLRPIESDHILAEICVWYLGLGGTDLTFLNYAAAYWTLHFNNACGTYSEELILRAAQICRPEPLRYLEWFETFLRHQE
ncbi:hypothetical protein AAE478_008381 [Parahypoxylon ruwenzoriense]